jgi:hypothetical protein
MPNGDGTFKSVTCKIYTEQFIKIVQKAESKIFKDEKLWKEYRKTFFEINELLSKKNLSSEQILYTLANNIIKVMSESDMIEHL